MPITRELIDYVKNCLMQGYRENNIRSILKIYDWQERDIDEAFKIAKDELSKQKSIVQSHHPVPLINTKPPKNPASSLNHQLHKEESGVGKQLVMLKDGEQRMGKDEKGAFRLESHSQSLDFSEPKTRVAVFVFGAVLIIGLISFLAFPKQPNFESELDSELNQKFSQTADEVQDIDDETELDEQDFEQDVFEGGYLDNESNIIYENQSFENESQENLTASLGFENESFENESQTELQIVVNETMLVNETTAINETNATETITYNETINESEAGLFEENATELNMSGTVESEEQTVVESVATVINESESDESEEDYYLAW